MREGEGLLWQRRWICGISDEGTVEAGWEKWPYALDGEIWLMIGPADAERCVFAGKLTFKPGGHIVRRGRLRRFVGFFNVFQDDKAGSVAWRKAAFAGPAAGVSLGNDAAYGLHLRRRPSRGVLPSCDLLGG